MRLTSNSGLAFAAVVLGTSTAFSVRADTFDPCSLLASSQVATALSVPAVNASPATNRCIWTPAKYAPGSKSVTLQLQTESGFAAQRARPDASPVSGIGDEAVQTGAVVPVLTVRKGRRYFTLTAHLPADEARAATQALAKQVASKL